MDITKITKQNVKTIIAAAEAAIRREMRRSNLDAARKGRVTYDDSTMTIKFEVTVPELKERRDEVSNHLATRTLGLPDDIIGTWFNSPTPTGRDRWFKVIELHLRKPRYPIIATNENGKRFKFTVESVKGYLKNK